MNHILLKATQDFELTNNKYFKMVWSYWNKSSCLWMSFYIWFMFRELNIFIEDDQWWIFAFGNLKGQTRVTNPDSYDISFITPDLESHKQFVTAGLCKKALCYGNKLHWCLSSAWFYLAVSQFENSCSTGSISFSLNFLRCKRFLLTIPDLKSFFNFPSKFYLVMEFNG